LAKHRQNVLTLQAPAELAEFDPREWATNDQGPWSTPFNRWVEARRAWIETRGAESLGGWLELLRVEHRALMAHLSGAIPNG
jgi:hypothetical protein